MEKKECPNLCEGCPIRSRIDGEPTIIAELGYQALGEISMDGRSASFEFQNGLPVGERTSTIGVANADGKVGSRFLTEGRNWDDGTVVETFKRCDGPKEIKYGLFKRKKYLGCMAVENL